MNAAPHTSATHKQHDGTCVIHMLGGYNLLIYSPLTEKGPMWCSDLGRPNNPPKPGDIHEDDVMPLSYNQWCLVATTRTPNRRTRSQISLNTPRQHPCTVSPMVFLQLHGKKLKLREVHEGGEGGGGKAYSRLGRLSRYTINHAPTPPPSP